VKVRSAVVEYGGLKIVRELDANCLSEVCFEGRPCGRGDDWFGPDSGTSWLGSFSLYKDFRFHIEAKTDSNSDYVDVAIGFK
jgi:hypothetical protein